MESIWQNASNHYKYFNEKKFSIKDYTISSEDNINRRDLTKFLRLRFGHTSTAVRETTCGTFS